MFLLVAFWGSCLLVTPFCYFFLFCSGVDVVLLCGARSIRSIELICCCLVFFPCGVTACVYVVYQVHVRLPRIGLTLCRFNAA